MASINDLPVELLRMIFTEIFDSTTSWRIKFGDLPVNLHDRENEFAKLVKVCD